MYKNRLTAWRAATACWLTAAAVVAAATLPARAAHPELPTLAVLPFEIEDTSGETGAPDRHDAMLAETTRLAREKIAEVGLYDVVAADRVASAVVAIDPGTHLRRCNGCELDIATRAGARYVLIGWIYKMSTLILTLHIDLKDVETGQTVYARVFDFRGDNARAYAHAVKTMVRSLAESLPPRPQGSAAPAPGKSTIAVFDFELEDTSAAGGIIPPDAFDIKYLSEATAKAKSLLEASGKYAVVGSAGTPLEATAAKYGVRNCDGCEARMAQKLGADLAMLGVVTRVNRTEHTLLIKIVDARTGAAVSTDFTDLRMGANYAWPRSVTWLMTRRVLERRAGR